MMVLNCFDNNSDGDDDDDDGGGGSIVCILTCAVLSPKCLKLVHSSSLQEGNLKERNWENILFLFLTGGRRDFSIYGPSFKIFDTTNECYTLFI